MATSAMEMRHAIWVQTPVSDRPSTGDPIESSVDDLTICPIIDLGCSADIDCDGGSFCNGDETCNLGTNTAVAGAIPCQAGEFCDEANGICVECLENSHWDDGSFCNETETCNLVTNTSLLEQILVQVSLVIRQTINA